MNGYISIEEISDVFQFHCLAELGLHLSQNLVTKVKIFHYTNMQDTQGFGIYGLYTNRGVTFREFTLQRGLGDKGPAENGLRAFDRAKMSSQDKQLQIVILTLGAFFLPKIKLSSQRSNTCASELYAHGFMGTRRYTPDKKCPIFIFADMISPGPSLHLNNYFVRERFAINKCSRAIVVVFVFNVPPTAKVIWRWGHG